MGVTRGAVNRFVSGDIRLSVLKLYAVNGSVKKMAASEMPKEDTSIFKIRFINLNPVNLSISAFIFPISPEELKIPRVAKKGVVSFVMFWLSVCSST
jgi:hypothetical protein